MFFFVLFAGSLIPPHCVPALIGQLSQDCARTYTEHHQQSLQSALNGLHSSSKSLPSPALPRSNGIAFTPGSAGSSFTLKAEPQSVISPPFSLLSSRLAPQTPEAAAVGEPVPSLMEQQPQESSSSSSMHSEPLLSMPSFDFL
jgi:hypothetical protein